MEKLNRNNADINEILNKKVGVVCPTEEIELDFRKWAKQYVNAVNDKYTYANCYSFCKTREDVCIFIRNDGTKWEFVECFKNSDYDIYEWEIAEEQKTYTIKDVVENEGKLYKIAGSSGLHKYKYENGKLITNSIIADSWVTSVLNLKELLELKFIEYKPESKISAFKIITFEEALKEMEQGKVCRSLYSGAEYLLSNNHFEKLNRNYTTLSYKEIKEGWVVLE